MNDLRDVFERQRRAESAGAPSFAATVARAHRHARQNVARRGLKLYGVLSAAAVVVLAGVTLRGWFGTTTAIEWSAPLGVELNTVSWTAPTDFLLRTPDAEALRGMPRLVRLRDLTPARPTPVNDTND